MKNNFGKKLVLFLLSSMLIAPSTYSYVIDDSVLLLLTGPVSEAVQETVLLIRRGDNFITLDSLVIGCVAGASSGAMIAVAPALGFLVGTATMPSLLYIAGTSLLSCGMSLISGVVGMYTQSILK